MVLLPVKGVWSSVIWGSGLQCVIFFGVFMRHRLCVDNLAIQMLQKVQFAA